MEENVVVFRTRVHLLPIVQSKKRPIVLKVAWTPLLSSAGTSPEEIKQSQALAECSKSIVLGSLEHLFEGLCNDSYKVGSEDRYKWGYYGAPINE